MPNGMTVVPMAGMGSGGCAWKMAGIAVMLGKTGRFWSRLSAPMLRENTDKVLLCSALQNPL